MQTRLSGPRPRKLTRNAAVANRWPEAVRSGGGEPGCAAEMLAVKMATTATFVMKTESREYVGIFFFYKKTIKKLTVRDFLFMKTNKSGHREILFPLKGTFGNSRVLKKERLGMLIFLKKRTFRSKLFLRNKAPNCYFP